MAIIDLLWINKRLNLNTITKNNAMYLSIRSSDISVLKELLEDGRFNQVYYKII